MFRLIRPLSVVLSSLLIAAMALFVPVTAHAAPGDPAPVTIRVEADLPAQSNSQGPIVWEVTNVVPGPGIELTPAHEIANPSDWVGDFTVDVDPIARTITIEAGESDYFEVVRLTVTSTDFDGATVTLDSDTLMVLSTQGGDVVPATWSHTGTTLSAEWADDADGLDNTGSTVFSYTVQDVPNEDEAEDATDGDDTDESVPAAKPQKAAHPMVAPASGM